MARPRTTLGTAGKVSVVPQIHRAGRWVSAPEGAKPERWRARTKYRDADGVLRDVERYAATKGRAETTLKAALAERTTPSGQGAHGIRADMTVCDAGALWLSQVARPDSGLSDSTRGQYAAAWRRYVEGSTITGLTLREANRVPVLRAWLQATADAHGTGSAKTARSALSGVLSLAVADGALPANALREVRPARRSVPVETSRPRDTTRAMTRAERDHVLRTADAHERAVALDVADVMWFMAGTGVRISEALAVGWADVDLGGGTVHVRGTKTASADRVLALPQWLCARLTARGAARGTAGLVFPSPGLRGATRPRDRRNVARVLREVLDSAGLPWATPHTFRRTVASLIDLAGLSVAEAAEHLGHADPAMTARVYLGRRVSTSRAAAIL